ncbi:MAG TPA: alpha/beta fold hydrolase [Candidatus Competibacteraceae bacterium]|nr:alpha/beta fold hydrolase [Candidatus Competibacteraceae bacterium]
MPDARTPLLLIPGLLCDAALWAPQIAHLQDIAEIRVADHTGYHNLSDLARAILTRAPPRFAVAGLSMGGYIALELLRQAPERVVRLALLNTSARPDTPEQRRRRLGFIALVRRGRFLGVGRGLLPNLIHPSRLKEAELTGIILEMTQRTGAEAFIRQEHAIIGRPDSRPLLPTIECPTLVIGGRQDQMTPLYLQEELADAIPGARLVVIENCGHLSTLERPAEVNQALRAWLER